MKIIGKCISPGFAYGKILYSFKKEIPYIPLTITFVEAMANYDKAVKQVTKNINNQKEKHEFLDAHILIVQDPVLRKRVEEYLINNKVDIVYAFSIIINEYINKIKNAEDKYLKERYLDLLDIKQQVIKELNKQEEKKIEEDTILVTDELIPSDVLNINEKIKGIISFSGGFTSHSSILCRAMGIAYTHIGPLNETFESAMIINDTIYFNPNQEELRRINNHKESIDYHGASLYANMTGISCLKKIKEKKFKGIGLYRSEFLFMAKGRFLDYDEQKKVYSQILKEMYPKTVIFRTFDFGDDKTIPGYSFEKGVENYHRYREMFFTQVKAMIDANIGNLKIMFPYIKTKEEFIELRSLVFQETKTILPVGMMLETKEAIQNIENFKDASFFSLGTNDLLHELFNISREELDIEKYIDPLKEYLIPVVEFCKKEKKPLCVCGEMASINKAVKMFLEIGIDKFSILSNAI